MSFRDLSRIPGGLADPYGRPLVGIAQLANRDPEILAHAVHAVTKQADDDVVDEAIHSVGLDPVTGRVGTAPISAMLVSITSVTNLVRHGCRDHSQADPPVGPSADDLATALAHLAPFRVTSPPKDVTIYGYSGKHLELTVPDMPFEVRGDQPLYTECTDYGWHRRDLMSWITPQLVARRGYAYYGYSGPGHTEHLWILDVEGTRLVIAADRSPGSPREDIAEMRAILHSIRIEP